MTTQADNLFLVFLTPKINVSLSYKKENYNKRKISEEIDRIFIEYSQNVMSWKRPTQIPSMPTVLKIYLIQ